MPDHLLDWWRVRAEIDWATAARPVTGPIRGDRDGVAEFVRARGGERLEAALSQARQDSGGLDFALLARWQARVLGVAEVGFRTGAAFAKGGRERYGLRADTRQRFADCLAEAADPLVPLPSRAARIYLDVAFCHPFPDGNARAALLCFDHVLRRDQVTIELAAPALTVVRRADDRPGTLDLIRLIEVLIEATGAATARRHPPRAG